MDKAALAICQACKAADSSVCNLTPELCGRMSVNFTYEPEDGVYRLKPKSELGEKIIGIYDINGIDLAFDTEIRAIDAILWMDEHVID